LKLEAWAIKKNALQFSLESQPAQANYCRSIYSDHSGSKRPNGFERILAHRIDCQRARPPCPAERLTNNLMSIRMQSTPVNNQFVISTKILSDPHPTICHASTRRTVTLTFASGNSRAPRLGFFRGCGFRVHSTEHFAWTAIFPA
jgi:hypothetical protein